MSTTAFLTALAVLAVGTYALRAGGLLLRDRLPLSPGTDEALNRAVAVLLAGVLVSTTLFDGTEPAGTARLAGVAAGGLCTLARLPLAAALLTAAGCTAALRLLGIG
ncbi:AzlD domain-containing protein [Nocardiopsis sp. CNT-189]|uniref:AzlD domain-containing protein n=1 Tax=Nocardiopsis oceanisediminis TaxID=2816862 RepID=UPI003B2ADF50